MGHDIDSESNSDNAAPDELVHCNFRNHQVMMHLRLINDRYLLISWSSQMMRHETQAQIFIHATASRAMQLPWGFSLGLQGLSNCSQLLADRFMQLPFLQSSFFSKFKLVILVPMFPCFLIFKLLDFLIWLFDFWNEFGPFSWYLNSKWKYSDKHSLQRPWFMILSITICLVVIKKYLATLSALVCLKMCLSWSNCYCNRKLWLKVGNNILDFKKSTEKQPKQARNSLHQSHCALKRRSLTRASIWKEKDDGIPWFWAMLTWYKGEYSFWCCLPLGLDSRGIAWVPISATNFLRNSFLLCFLPT